MNMNEYQRLARHHSKVKLGYNDVSFAILGLGVGAEAGEVQDLIKKFFRDMNSNFTPEWKRRVFEELGDTLWYIAMIAERCGYKLDNVAQGNIDKIKAISEENERNEHKGSA